MTRIRPLLPRATPPAMGVAPEAVPNLARALDAHGGIGTPFVSTAVLTFAEGGGAVDIAVDQNLSFAPTVLLRATARPASPSALSSA